MCYDSRLLVLLRQVQRRRGFIENACNSTSLAVILVPLPVIAVPISVPVSVTISVSVPIISMAVVSVPLPVITVVISFTIPVAVSFSISFSVSVRRPLLALIFSPLEEHGVHNRGWEAHHARISHRHHGPTSASKATWHHATHHHGVHRREAWWHGSPSKLTRTATSSFRRCTWFAFFFVFFALLQRCSTAVLRWFGEVSEVIWTDVVNEEGFAVHFFVSKVVFGLLGCIGIVVFHEGEPF
mmetsp:Transcript_1475/g.1949  ORF Transcript_1475/g.1949 Transcript_1475/m.1949 type:complete len:241 (+) Transcript_1475:35-757(+)